MKPELMKKYADIVSKQYLNEDVETAEEMLSELEEVLNQAVDICNMLERVGSDISGPFSGQIRAYIRPHLQAWIEDSNQPGSIASLRRIIEDHREEEHIRGLSDEEAENYVSPRR